MKSNIISKILGVGVSAGMVVALSGAMIAAPVAADTTEWSTINTPSWENGVILPANNILDYDISGADGNTIYVIAEVDRACAEANPFLDDDVDDGFDYGLFKSSDGGVTWTDITQNVIDADNLPDFDGLGSVDALDIESLNYVAVAPDDEDWVAVTGYGDTGPVPTNVNPPFTVASKDGGDNFAFTGEMEDDENGTSMDVVFDTEVSPETPDGLHLIAAMGSFTGQFGAPDNTPGIGPLSFLADAGTVYVLNAGTWLTGGWEDASFYDGWDGSEEGNDNLALKDINSLAEIDGEFSPNFSDDGALVVIGVAEEAEGDPDVSNPYVQTADLYAKQWGEEASFTDPIEITSDGADVLIQPGIWSEGIALPADYDATDPGARVVFGYVNAFNTVTELVRACIFRLDNDSELSVCAPSDNLLASIDVYGDADTGKVMVGDYALWDDDAADTFGVGNIVPAEPCAGVTVWHTEELDFCCPTWDTCCTFKCPSGPYVARVRYTPDGQKEYATTTGSDAGHTYDGFVLPLPDEDDINTLGEEYWGTPGDESAFSVSLDNGVSWNQLGLIDTDIDKLSDMVICPDCSVMYLSTINDGDDPAFFCGDFGDCTDGWWFACDSVWRSFDNGDTWERVFHGDWQNSEEDDFMDGPDPDVTGELLLRLPCEDTENCCDYTDPSAPGGTIYLGLQNTNEMFYSRDCGQCWTETPETEIDIQDFAVDTESTVYVIDYAGNVSKSTNFGRRWSDSMDTGIDSGHMITVCCAQGMVVIGGFGGDPVAWSDDGGDSWNTTDDVPVDGEVHVACATTCENIIYIAVDSMMHVLTVGVTNGIGGEEQSLPYFNDSGIFRGDLTDGSWADLKAVPGANYTGIAVGKSDGTLYASTDFITVDENEDEENQLGDWTPCLRTFNGSGPPAQDGIDGEIYSVSAVARNLDPCETACCGTEDWDYLICGLDKYAPCEGEDFDAEVNALDICGCLTAATNTKLYAIDSQEYDVRDGSDGTIWTYEDCSSKVGPTLVAPVNEAVLDCMACEGCGAQPFTLKWNRVCNSCSYDVEIMDEDGNVVVSLDDIVVTGESCSFYFNPDSAIDSENFFSELVCGSSYQWHVREADTSCECIHSRWSDTWTFTVAASTTNGVQLIAPMMAASDVGTANIGFSWTSVPDATTYSFVLSPNANLSGALVSQEISTTAFNYAGPLENEHTYYWQVKAWKGATLLSTSSVGVFTIAAAPVAPQPPVVVQEAPAPVITIPPAQQITPTWIYAIIGVGAALAVVVLILIVKSRR